MAKQIKIKDIAKMAGVSAGTVDRILHNRGNVSPASRAAVEKVLAEVDYKYNIHASAISLRKEYKIDIVIPTASGGEYWGAVKSGFEHALQEYSDIRIDCRFHYYNQFDIYSCRAAYSELNDSQTDAVIIGPTFTEETETLCRNLEKNDIPYIFVDSRIEGTAPLATYTTDQYACGAILGKLLGNLTPKESSIAIFGAKRIGNREANNSMERKKGVLDYFSSSGNKRTVKETSYSVLNPDENELETMNFLRNNPDVKGIAVLNSRGYIIADILKAKGIQIPIVSFDLTVNNRRCLEDGSISALLCQRPELQGFNAIKSAINHLLYKQAEAKIHHLMPIDILMKENLPFYRELFVI